jgi:hypothetical protein
MNTPTPITFVTLDGAEREFRLTNAQFLGIARATQAGKSIGPCEFLWHALADKSGLTEEAFLEILPLADFELLTGLMDDINKEWAGRNKADPRNEKHRPTKAATQ